MLLTSGRVVAFYARSCLALRRDCEIQLRNTAQALEKESRSVYDLHGFSGHKGGKEGKKKDQTNLTGLQSRKQWSIVSLCGKLCA